MISVIIPTYKNPQYLDLCLKSIVDNTASVETEIIVIEDGFSELNKDVLSKYQSVGVITLEENRGMAYAINIGVMQANNAWVFIVNDDNVFCKNWDIRLRAEIERLNQVYNNQNFVLTVDQIEPTGPGMFKFMVKDFGKNINDFRYADWLSYEESISENLSKEDGAIFPFVVQKKHFMAVGGFDTFYCSPNIVDWDHFLKYELLGFKFPRTRSLRLYHFGSVATKKNEDSNVFRSKESQAFEEYIYKWGCAPHNQPITNSKIPRERQFRGFNV
jgi:GT2 family glycosyltransferase